jgi:cell division protein FtsW
MNAYEYAKLVAPDKPQETHANIAIASSNILGKGPGNSDERDYLQEASCDFIYAIIIEELGMAGGVLVLLVYMILLFRVGRIATRCKEKYPAYLAMGLGMLLGLQAFINMSVAVGLFPVTGQPLPLISKGGTSVLMTSGCIGMLLGISNVLEKEERGEEAIGTNADIPSVINGNESFDEIQ